MHSEGGGVITFCKLLDRTDNDCICPLWVPSLVQVLVATLSGTVKLVASWHFVLSCQSPIISSMVKLAVLLLLVS